MHLSAVLLAALCMGTAAHAAHRQGEEDAVDTSGCKWFCENWCDLGSTGYCHQLECDPGKEKDCPGTSCELEAACRKSGSEKISDGDQILFILGVSAACLLAICIGALCCYVCCDAWIRAEGEDGNVARSSVTRKALEREGQRRQAAIRIQEAARSHFEKKSGGRSKRQPKSGRTLPQVSPRGTMTQASGAPLAFKKPAAHDMV